MTKDEGSITSVDVHMPVGVAPVSKRPFHYREYPWQYRLGSSGLEREQENSRGKTPAMQGTIWSDKKVCLYVNLKAVKIGGNGSRPRQGGITQ